MGYQESLAHTFNQMDELIQEKVSQKENELNATYDEKLRNYEERYVVIISNVRLQGRVSF